MKKNIIKCILLVVAILAILAAPVGVSAASQGTNGDEMQVATPEKLEIHLGQEWAGVTFELTTDYGKYPDPIPVGEDGVLRLEIGGSSSYVLSCLNSKAGATSPGETTPSEDATVNKDELVDIEEVDPTEPEEESGIPTSHIVMFGGGLVVAIGALIGISYFQKRRTAQSGSDENDEF